MNFGILHLSDIHFGRHHVKSETEREPLYTDNDYDSELNKIIEDLKILKKNGAPIDFVVITGDLTETSSPNEYKILKNFISGIIEFTKINKRNVMLIPGNHDVNRNLCQSARLRAQVLGEQFEKPYFAKFEIYKDFFDDFYCDVVWPSSIPPYKFDRENLFVNFIFPENKVLFCGLNSSIDESEIPPHYGNIGITQLSKAISEIDLYDKTNEYLRIVLMHHNFIRASHISEENLKDSGELLPLLMSNSFKILLHGHHHEDQETIIGKGNASLRVLATGSAGLDSNKLPENSRKYQLLHFKDNSLRIYRRRFDSKRVHNTGKGCWVPDIDPDQAEMFIELSLSQMSECIEPPLESNTYDLYKIKRGSTDELIFGEDILRISYPKREISIKGRLLDHKNKIYYEYLSVSVGLNHNMCFLFVGKNINITATIKHFIENHDLPKLGITICTPRVKSKQTGNAEFRAKNIQDSFISITKEAKKYSATYLLDTMFIDDFVWANCLDASITSRKEEIAEDEFFIDQNIFSIKKEGSEEIEIDEGMSLKYFKNIFSKKFEEDYYSPITVILGYGGIGKTTLCNKIVNIINSHDRKKAIYINSFDLIEKIQNTDVEIKSITDLFRLYDSLTGFQLRSLHEPNNLEINISCGNLIAVIDGLDEIESYLKGKFDLESFLVSLSDIHEQFNNCKIIITSRDYHKEKYINKAGINILCLKGFDDNLTKYYFEKRFQLPELRSKGIEYSKRLGIKSDDRYMPLCLSLISQIVERDDYGKGIKKDELFDTKLLKPTQNPIDDLLCRLIEREMAKQHLNVTIDQLVEFLLEITVVHNGHINISDFNEYIEIYFHSSISHEKNGGFSSFQINPLLILKDNIIHLRYDILYHLFQARYVQKVFNEKTFNPNLISLFSENAFGVGNVFDELIKSTHPSNNFLDISKQALIYFIKEYNKDDKSEINDEVIKKAISSLLYYNFLIFKPQTKSDSSELLKSLYGTRLQYVFIYGDFFPLDFCNITIFDGSFIGYGNLFKSIFPTDRVVFHYCYFENLRIKGNPHIPKNVFDVTCSIPLEMKYLFEIDSQNRTAQYQIIKSDIKMFFKSFVYTNSFGSKTINNINSKYSSKLSKKNIVDEAIGHNLIYIDPNKKRSVFYAINSQFYNSVLSLLNQNNLDNNLEAFCNDILTKFYKQI